MNGLLRFSGQPGVQNPSLIVGWSVDAISLGAKVTDYLTRKLGGQSFGEIEPVEFFPLAGVTIEENLVQFPESNFYSCPRKDLVIFKSTPPSYEWYKFLNLVLDVAEHNCHVKEIYTIGAMVSLGAHTAPREIRGTFNSPEMKKALTRFNIAGGLDYETPPGQRPTLNAFLLWMAKRRNIPGVNLWIPIPFYLISVNDPKSEKSALEFFNQRLGLEIDLSDLDEEIRHQNRIIAEARDSLPDIDRSISKLESNLSLSDEENQRLVIEVERLIREKREQSY